MVDLGSGSSVLSVKDGRVMVDVCISDGLPCSRDLKGVGIGACIRKWGAGVRICCRFSDVSIFEDWFRKIRVSVG